MAYIKTKKGGKNVASICKNPLFKALNGATTSKAKIAFNISKATRTSKQSKPRKDNELASRLGIINAVGSKKVTAKKLNPLEAALNNIPRVSKETMRGNKNTKVKPTKIAGVRDDSRNRKSKTNFDSRLDRQQQPYSLGSINPSINRRHKIDMPYCFIDQEMYSQSTGNGRRPEITVSFRNASLIPFLRISNIAPDVTETDIRSVLTNRLGPPLKILKRNTIYKNQPAVCAEAFFLDKALLQQHAASFNNIRADGRRLKAEVATRSVIIHADKLWEDVLREVRYLTQEALSKL